MIPPPGVVHHWYYMRHPHCSDARILGKSQVSPDFHSLRLGWPCLLPSCMVLPAMSSCPNLARKVLLEEPAHRFLPAWSVWSCRRTFLQVSSYALLGVILLCGYIWVDHVLLCACDKPWWRWFHWSAIISFRYENPWIEMRVRQCSPYSL